MHKDDMPPDKTDKSSSHIPEITKKELDQVLRAMKNNKAADQAGIVAEMLKTGGVVLRQCLLDLYNNFIKPDAPTPQSWQHTVIKVLFKSGDPQLPDNYRPMASLPS